MVPTLQRCIVLLPTFCIAASLNSRDGSGAKVLMASSIVLAPIVYSAITFIHPYVILNRTVCCLQKYGFLYEFFLYTKHRCLHQLWLSNFRVRLCL